MPDQPVSLEDLARAAVEAWDTWLVADSRDGPEMLALNEKMHVIDLHFRRMPDSPPPRAGAYLTPGERVQIELRFACALIAAYGGTPSEIHGQAVIDKARYLARLLLDGPEKE